MIAQRMIFKYRAARLNRQIDALLRRASRPHVPSAHLVSHVPVQPAVQIDDMPDFGQSPWFIVAAVATAFVAGCLVGDDKRPDDQVAHAPIVCNAGFPGFLIRLDTNNNVE